MYSSAGSRGGSATGACRVARRALHGAETPLNLVLGIDMPVRSSTRVLASIGALQVLVMLVALVRSKALSLLLGPGGFGVASTIDQTVTTLAQLGALSLTFTAMKFMSRAHSEGEEAFRASYATFLRALVGLAFVTTAIALTVLLVQPRAFGSDMAPYRVALAIGMLGIPASMLAILFINTFASAQLAPQSALVGLLAALSLAVGAIVGQLAGGLPGLYVGTVAAGALNTLVTMAWLRRRLGLQLLGHAGSVVAWLRASPEIVSYSALLYVAMAAYSVTLLATRYFVFEGLGAVQAGLFQALFSLALTVGAVMGPMNNLFLTPLVNRSIPLEEKLAAANDFTGKMAVLLLAAALPLVLFPELVLTILFSAKFTPAAGMLFLFIGWQCLYQLVNVYVQLLIGLDDIAFVALLTCATYALVALLFPPLIREVGLGGAALALSVGMLASGAGASLRLRLRFGGRLSAALVARIAFVMAAILGAGLLFPRAMGEGSFAGVAARAAYGTVALAALWLFARQDERALAIAGMNRVLGRLGVRAGRG